MFRRWLGDLGTGESADGAGGEVEIDLGTGGEDLREGDVTHVMLAVDAGITVGLLLEV